MKIKDLIILTIATFFLTLCIRNLTLEITYTRIGLTLIPLYIILYVILAITHEKRLERELNILQGQFDTLYKNWEAEKKAYAYQVLITEEQEKKLKDERQAFSNQVEETVQAERFITVREGTIYELYKALDDIDTTSDIYKSDIISRCENIDRIVQESKNNIEVPLIEALYDRYYKKEEDILTPLFPFSTDNDTTTEQYRCPECGQIMHRHTSKIAFCDNSMCHRKQWKIDKLGGK